MLALVGEPGIGKTALLDARGRERRRDAGLRARGVESEAQVPFAGLLELLRPGARRCSTASRSRRPRRSAGALALRPGRRGGPLRVGAATLSLLAAYAEDGPLLLLVDDAHWLDGSSAEALLFAFRRLVADPIAVVLAVREGEPSLLDGADLRVAARRGA